MRIRFSGILSHYVMFSVYWGNNRKKEIWLVCYKWAIRHCKYLPVVANKSVVCDDIKPEVVSMVVEGGFVGLASSHVRLTNPFPPAGKTRYIYKYICKTAMISIIILAVLLYL